MIENNDGYRFFYVKGNPIKREQDLQLLFKLTWFARTYDVNAEVNNGRGPVACKISNGSKDKSLVEFKFTPNRRHKQTPIHQDEIYEAANCTHQSIRVILFFSDSELEAVSKVMRELKLKEDKGFVLIDARPNKVSASNVRDMFEDD